MSSINHHSSQFSLSTVQHPLPISKPQNNAAFKFDGDFFEAGSKLSPHNQSHSVKFQGRGRKIKQEDGSVPAKQKRQLQIRGKDLEALHAAVKQSDQTLIAAGKSREGGTEMANRLSSVLSLKRNLTRIDIQNARARIAHPPQKVKVESPFSANPMPKSPVRQQDIKPFHQQDIKPFSPQAVPTLGFQNRPFPEAWNAPSRNAHSHPDLRSSSQAYSYAPVPNAPFNTTMWQMNQYAPRQISDPTQNYAFIAKMASPGAKYTLPPDYIRPKL